MRWVVSAVFVLFAGVSSAVPGTRVPLLGLVNFGIHEFGHLVFGVLGNETIMLLGGSFAQVALPMGLCGYFLIARQEAWVSAGLLAWAGTSLREVAWYLGDAPYQRMELWGGEGVVHDWYILLSDWGLVMQAEGIALFLHVIGVLAVLGALVWCALGWYAEKTRVVSVEPSASAGDPWTGM